MNESEFIDINYTGERTDAPLVPPKPKTLEQHGFIFLQKRGVTYYEMRRIIAKIRSQPVKILYTSIRRSEQQ